jgi:serine/threonine protein kinase/tetratricopeptide (TPR) repeat protein
MNDPGVTDDRLVELAGAVADGQTPDWDSEEAKASTPEESAVIGRLRTIAAICRVESLGGDNHPASWGPLRILGLAGRGRFGDVYRAWDPTLDRIVALKLLRDQPGRSGERTAPHQEVVEEGRLMARVRHPNVVTIYGAQRVDGRTGLWMEFIDGRTLEADLHDGLRFDAHALVSIGVELCRALGAVHDAGLVHRDVKSTNVMRDPNGRVVLGDFGTGLELDEPEAERIGLAGTPAFLAPEIFVRGAATLKSDLYSLGALLFRLATGSYPVSGRSIRELRESHEQGRRVSLREARPDLPARLSSVIDRALDPDPSRRFPDAGAMARALSGAMGMPRRLAIAAGLVLVSGGLVAGLVWRNSLSGIPAFKAGDWVLVTNFENRTGEPLFDRSIELALQMELALSTFVNVVSPRRAADALVLTGHPLATSLDRSIGREVALRDGAIAAVIAGTIDKTPSGYIITAEILHAANGRTGATLVESVPAESDVTAAIRRQAIDLRQALGEPADSIRAARQLHRMPPPALRALRRYAEAIDATHQVSPQTDAARAAFGAVLTEYPNFPPALVMVARYLSLTNPGIDRYLSAATQSVAAAAEEPPLVRQAVSGAYHDLRSFAVTGEEARRLEREQAVSAYEALLKIRPDDGLAIGRLIRLYLQAGRDRASEDLRIRLAKIRPTSFDANAEAARVLLRRDESTPARRFNAQAMAILASGAIPIEVISAAGVRLFDIAAAWAWGDTLETLRLVDAAAAAVDQVPAKELMPYRQVLVRHYLALGRLKQAEDQARQIPGRASRNNYLAWILSERGDIDGLRAHMAGPFGYTLSDAQQVPYFVRAGMLKEAEAALTRLERDFGPTPWAHLRRGQGRFDEAIALYEQYLNTHDPFPRSLELSAPAYLGLSDAWEAKGEVAKAIDVLQAGFSRRSETAIDVASGRPGGIHWIEARAKLALLYRRVGRDARPIEQELRALLNLADPDHPVVLQLNAAR